MDPSAPGIDTVVVDAILSGRIAAGTRLGEQQLVQLFGVSRTVVREALIRLETRGIVQVSARRGWFVIAPSLAEAREAFQARRAIEIGLLHSIAAMEPQAIARLREHVAREQAAIRGRDVAARSYLLGDFHVCMAEALGNRLIADILRDLTARTMLISMMYQSNHDASASCDEHVGIVRALEAGDIARAARLMDEHIGHVEAGLRLRAAPDKDPLHGLRAALMPAPPGKAPPLPSPARKTAARAVPSPSPSKRKAQR